MSLSRKLVTLANRLTRNFKTSLYAHYPIDAFEQRHVEHLVSVPTREDILAQMKKNAVVAEIGVASGDFSEKILSITQPEKLILIDIWGSKRYHGGLFEKVKNRFDARIKSGQIDIIRELSFEGIASCADGTFDWVYLDTDHTYDTTAKELELLRPKMKKGGVIAGHDYIMGNWNAGYRYGVIEAVRAFCVKYNWEMIYLSHELHIPASFAIREIV